MLHRFFLLAYCVMIWLFRLDIEVEHLFLGSLLSSPLKEENAVMAIKCSYRNKNSQQVKLDP